MNRVLIGIVVGIFLSGPVSAAGARYFSPMTQPPRVAAGIIARDGTIVAGSGFTVVHRALGEYDITFNNGVFKGCASMVANQTGATRGRPAYIAAVSQPLCRNTFHVKMWVPDSDARGDRSFHFVVVQVL